MDFSDQQLNQWLSENPEPIKFTWGSPELQTWLHEQNAPPVIPESAIGNRAFFAKPQMTEFRNFISTVSGGVWNSDQRKFYQIDPAGQFSSPKLGNRFIQIGADEPVWFGDVGTIENTYHLDSETGKVWKLDDYVFQEYLNGIDFDEQMAEDTLTELLRQNQIVSESFQDFLLDQILYTRRSEWSRAQPKNPISFAENYNILRIMAGMSGLSYSN